MKKYVQVIICSLAVIALLLPVAFFSASAEGTTDLTVKVTYRQSDARTMLDMINNLRTSQETGLEAVTYDYALEKVAMQRAAEIAVLYRSDHQRPDGSAYYTIYGTSAAAENIAFGINDLTNAAMMFDAWAGSSIHRPNMISDAINVIGVAHVVVGDAHFWVQALGYKDSPNTSATAANNGSSSVKVSILSDRLTLANASFAEESYTLAAGETASAPTLTLEYSVDGRDSNLGSSVFSYPSVTWNSSDETVVSVNGNQLTGVKAGTATLTATYGTAQNDRIDVPFTVTAKSISGAAVTLEYSQVSYTGNDLTPSVSSVVLDGTTLAADTDYTVTYSNNKNVGTATVTVTGKGQYKDTASATFVINECTHVPGSAANCGTAQTCTLCGTQIAPAAGSHADTDNDGKCDACGAAMTSSTTSSTETTETTETTASTESTSSSTSTTTSSTTSTTKSTTKSTASTTKKDTSGSPDTGDLNKHNDVKVALLVNAILCSLFLFFIVNLRKKQMAGQR